MVREFRTQRRFWEEQVFNCKVGSDLYPSKKDEKKYDPKRRYNPAIPRTIGSKIMYPEITATMVTWLFSMVCFVQRETLGVAVVSR
jgi:hypothetical protein